MLILFTGEKIEDREEGRRVIEGPALPPEPAIPVMSVILSFSSTKDASLEGKLDFFPLIFHLLPSFNYPVQASGEYEMSKIVTQAMSFQQELRNWSFN